MLFWLSVIALWFFTLLFLLPRTIQYVLIRFFNVENLPNEDRRVKLINFFNHKEKIIEGIGLTMGIISFIVLFIMLLIMISYRFYMNDAYVQQRRERYHAIQFKLEKQYDKDEFYGVNPLVTKEIIDEVQAWNEDLIYYQTLQNDFWIGIFIPNIYDQFKPIEYEELYFFLK